MFQIMEVQCTLFLHTRRTSYSSWLIATKGQIITQSELIMRHITALSAFRKRWRLTKSVGNFALLRSGRPPIFFYPKFTQNILSNSGLSTLINRLPTSNFIETLPLCTVLKNNKPRLSIQSSFIISSSKYSMTNIKSTNLIRCIIKGSKIHSFLWPYFPKESLKES